MSEWSNKTVCGLFQYTSSTDSVSEWSNKTVCGLFQYTSSTACQNGVTRLFGLFQILLQRVSSTSSTSSTACQNGVTRLFMDCSSILVVQRVRME